MVIDRKRIDFILGSLVLVMRDVVTIWIPTATTNYFGN